MMSYEVIVNLHATCSILVETCRVDLHQPQRPASAAVLAGPPKSHQVTPKYLFSPRDWHMLQKKKKRNQDTKWKSYYIVPEKEKKKDEISHHYPRALGSEEGQQPTEIGS